MSIEMNKAKVDSEFPFCLRVQDIADYLGCSRGTAFSLVKLEGFPSVRVHRKRIVVPRDKFLEWVDKQAEKKLSGIR